MERLLLIGCPALMGPEPAGAGALGDAAGTGEGDGPGDAEGGRLRRLAAVADALTEICPWIDAVRPGVLALPLRGPARYFGGDDAVADRVAEIVTATLEASPLPAGPTDTPDRRPRPVLIGAADGVFAAALAALAGRLVAPGRTPAFLAPWPVATLAEPELADLLVRLGLPTLGAFAALPARDVVARLGSDGALRHRIARGLDGDRPGYRVPDLAARLAALERHVPLQNHQPGFWGGVSAADERAAEALVGLQRQLGSGAVSVVSTAGGRGPADRVRFTPWRADQPVPDPDAGGGSLVEPWPGRLLPPFPARVPGAAPVELVDQTGAPVAVTTRGLLTAVPDQLSVAGERWAAVTGWSAPWPVDERWWSPDRHRAVRLQVATADGRALLLAAGHLS
ncbi:MAG TPA: hypothetical protein VHX40_00705, partial [Acidimicrobiales bacterium]|nr:hypothetical protein [Acidimicrobiales bacterium]